MDFSQDAPVTSFDVAQPICKPSYQSLRRTGTLTGAAAIASAGMLIPSGAAIANPIHEPPVLPAQSKAQSNRAIAADSQQSQGLLPQVAQPSRTAFSADARSYGRSRLEPANAEPSVLVRAEDGSWRLSEQWTNQPQALTQSAQASPTCIGSDCRKLAYIEVKLSKARQKAQAVDEAMKVFETQDMTAYRKVLGDRMTEVAQQKVRLSNELDQAERLTVSLKLQLAAVDVDVKWPEQVLSQDQVYQSAWQRLQMAEQSLLEEFSQAELDATTLNAIYIDYQQRQQQLALAAQESFSRYMLSPDAVAPEAIYRIPAAIDTMQALIVLTHEQQVQRLREATLSQLDQRLQIRQQQLVTRLGEYERLQGQQTTAQTVVTQYEQERDRRLRRQQSASQPAQPPSEPSRAWSLALPLSDSKLVNTILGGLVLAGGAAIASARHQSKKGIAAIALPEGTALTPHPNAYQEADPIKTGQFQVQPAGKGVVGEAIYGSQDGWDIDLTTRELHKMLTESTPAATFTYAAKTRLIEALHLSLEEEEVALFADYAARWMVQEFEAELLTESLARIEGTPVLVRQG